MWPLDLSMDNFQLILIRKYYIINIINIYINYPLSVDKYYLNDGLDIRI